MVYLGHVIAARGSQNRGMELFNHSSSKKQESEAKKERKNIFPVSVSSLVSIVYGRLAMNWVHGGRQQKSREFLLISFFVLFPSLCSA
jgi:hypothetical protein